MVNKYLKLLLIEEQRKICGVEISTFITKLIKKSTFKVCNVLFSRTPMNDKYNTHVED